MQGSMIRFRSSAATRMACEENMDQERVFMKALDAATASRIDGDRLKCRTAIEPFWQRSHPGSCASDVTMVKAVLIHDDDGNPQQGWTATGGSTFERYTSSLGRSEPRRAALESRHGRSGRWLKHSA
jgi:Heat shock protein